MPGPLHGVRVLDMGRVIAAPYCSMVLADLGADVVKVERPSGNGDELRAYGPPFLNDQNGEPTAESPYYLASNRSKRAICVDFTKPEGQEIIKRLAEQSDVLIENYKVGDLARYGLDYASMRQVNDRLVYCSVTGFGQTGPMAKRAGLDIMFQGLSGIMSMTGEADGPPMRVGIPIGDVMGGLSSVYAILAALYHRDVHGGAGQHIDMSMLDSLFAAMSHRVQTYLVSGEQPARVGNQTPFSVPADAYVCQDGQSILLQAYDDRHFARLTASIGRPELASDARFSSRSARYGNKEELNEILVEAFKTRPMAEWLDILVSAEIIHSAVNDLAAAVDHPQLRHREMTFDVPHPVAGSLKMVRNPVRFSETPIDRYFAPPVMGQHTSEVLAEMGFSEGRLASLREDGIIR